MNGDKEFLGIDQKDLLDSPFFNRNRGLDVRYS